MSSNKPLIPGGYVILPRQLIEDEIWNKPPLYLKIWIYILTKAQHSEYKQMKRGETFISIPEIQEQCSWKVGYRTVKPKKDEVYQAVDWMRKKGSTKATPKATLEATASPTTIATTKATQGMFVKVLHYSIYQDSKNYESNTESNSVSNSESNNEKEANPHNINKNVKNDKNDNKDRIPYEGIIDHLNQQAKTSFRSTTKKTKDLIAARWNEGNTLQDFKIVINYCCREWKGKEFSNGQVGDNYLQPSTLFNGKFEERLMVARKSQQENPVTKKSRQNGNSQSSEYVEKKIAFNQFINDGGDPEEFIYKRE